VPLVPIEALLEADGNRGTVFALSSDGRRAERRQIAMRSWPATGWPVGGGGLDGVHRVITDGAAYLDDGQAVRAQP
jgi:hypothetical protein